MGDSRYKVALVMMVLLTIYFCAVNIKTHNINAFGDDLSYDKDSDQYTLTYQMQGEGFEPEETVPVYLYIVRESDGSVISEFTEILTADESGKITITPEFQINGSEFNNEKPDIFKVSGMIGSISWK